MVLSLWGEFILFIWWMKTTLCARRPPTKDQRWEKWNVAACKRIRFPKSVHNLLLLSPKTGTHFTMPRRLHRRTVESMTDSPSLCVCSRQRRRSGQLVHWTARYHISTHTPSSSSWLHCCRCFLTVLFMSNGDTIRRGRNNFGFSPLKMHCIQRYEFRYEGPIWLKFTLPQIQFPILKRHNCIYFEITLKVNYKRRGDIWRLMGRITETHDEVFNVTMVTVYVAEETNRLYIDGLIKAILI